MLFQSTVNVCLSFQSQTFKHIQCICHFLSFKFILMFYFYSLNKMIEVGRMGGELKFEIHVFGVGDG